MSHIFSSSTLLVALEAADRSVATGSSEDESGLLSAVGFEPAGEELAEKPWEGLGKKPPVLVYSSISSLGCSPGVHVLTYGLSSLQPVPRLGALVKVAPELWSSVEVGPPSVLGPFGSG